VVCRRSLLVRQFFELLHPGQVLHIFQLKDRFGPTTTDGDIEAIILSKEVEGAGPVINAQRTEHALAPIIVYVLDDVGLENKFSSTELRTQLQLQVENQGDWLKRKWMDLCRYLGVSEGSAWDWFSLLVRKYCRSQRGYHNLFQVLERLRKLEGRTLRNPNIVQLAIWFDDLIYHPYDPSQNERLSANLCRQFLTSLNVSGCDNAVSYILATEKHIALTDDHDELEFLDLGISILGAEPRRYAEYKAGIRKEYYFLSFEDFKEKRTDFLRGHLDRTQLFFLPHNRDAWEAKARLNMQKEVEALALS
jgi:predicted metal-dependent HD superfamily phosphohydrolase